MRPVVTTPPSQVYGEDLSVLVEEKVEDSVWKERCELLGGLTTASTTWWIVQQVIWVYCFVLALYAGYMWPSNWKEEAKHTEFTATLGAVKTVGFGLFDLCAFFALQASRKAYASEHLKALHLSSPGLARAKICCILGFLLALVQAVYWCLFIQYRWYRDSSVELFFLTMGGAGLVVTCPGLTCAFWPVLLSLSSAETRLDEFANEIEEGKVRIEEVLSKYSCLKKEISGSAKELYYTVMWLLLACLLYALLQCCSAWLWLSKVSDETLKDSVPWSVYVTYILAVLYSVTFGVGYGLFGGLEQRQSEIRSALEARITKSPADSGSAVIADWWIDQHPIKWKVPLSPKWPMAPTLERLQGALLVGTFAGKTGLKFIQQVHAELKDEKHESFAERLKLERFLHLEEKPKDETKPPKRRRRHWPWPRQEPGASPMKPIQGCSPVAPRIESKAHQQSSPVAFVPPGQWSKVLMALVAVMFLSQAKRRP